MVPVNMEKRILATQCLDLCWLFLLTVCMAVFNGTRMDERESNEKREKEIGDEQDAAHTKMKRASRPSCCKHEGCRESSKQRCHSCANPRCCQNKTKSAHAHAGRARVR